MSVMHFNDLFDLIDEALPGQRLWMQCVPVRDSDSPTEEGVGLAIQKTQKEPYLDKRSYRPVFFSVVPKNEALDDSGTLLPGRGEDASDWDVEIGYQEPFDTLAEAIEEAKVLARGLPMSPIFRTEERRAAILDAVTDPEDFEDPDPDDPDSDDPDPEIGPRTGRSQIIKQEMIWPKHDKENSENQETKE